MAGVWCGYDAGKQRLNATKIVPKYIVFVAVVVVVLLVGALNDARLDEFDLKNLD